MIHPRDRIFMVLRAEDAVGRTPPALSPMMDVLERQDITAWRKAFSPRCRQRAAL